MLLCAGIRPSQWRPKRRKEIKMNHRKIRAGELADFFMEAASKYVEPAERVEVLAGMKESEEANRLQMLVLAGLAFGKLPKPEGNAEKMANMTSAQSDQCVKLYPLLEQAAEELSLHADTGQIRLNLYKETEAYAWGNPNLLYRAFYNLIENAIKYNVPGGEVTIRQKQAAHLVSIEVEDSGVGIEKEALDHIFEPFYRADPSRSQKIPGSGLGLAVVEMIVDKYEGQVEVESEPGKGSIFRIYLTASEPAELS